MKQSVSLFENVLEGRCLWNEVNALLHEKELLPSIERFNELHCTSYTMIMDTLWRHSIIIPYLTNTLHGIVKHRETMGMDKYNNY